MDIKAPTFPESITEGTIAQWHVQEGQAARRDDLLVEVETDKVVIEIFAEDDGTVTKIVKAEGDTVLSEEVIGEFAPGEVGATPPPVEPSAEPSVEPSAEPTVEPSAEPTVEPTVEPEGTQPAPAQASTPSEPKPSGRDATASPAARKLALESRVDIGRVDGTGRDGRVTKEDVARAVVQGSAAPAPAAEPAPRRKAAVAEPSDFPIETGERIERRVPMTRLRASVARRLVEAQHNAAMLTTFNEVDMAPIMALRRQYQEDFQKAHNGTRLGFMSFFVRTCVEALKRFPAVNASIDDNDIVYHGYYDIGVAVSTDRGLVVPVVREADALSFAQIEDQINAYGEKARSGKLALEDMAGGTFTISNGGVFGSLLSTPILNPPQTGVLGMHKIEERPVVVNGEIVVKPMMYLALSYDHRLIDGREAVQFLVAIKGMIEDPARVLLEL